MSMAVRVHAMDGASGDNTLTKDHYTYLPFLYKDMYRSTFVNFAITYVFS